MHVPSLPEMLVVLIVGLLLFGTKRLPEVGASLGQGIREFKKSLQEIGDVAEVHSPRSGPGATDLRRPIGPDTSFTGRAQTARITVYIR